MTMKNEMADKLDILMVHLFKYIYEITHTNGKIPIADDNVTCYLPSLCLLAHKASTEFLQFSLLAAAAPVSSNGNDI